MKFIFDLYARPLETESITSKHNTLVENLLRLGPPWGLENGLYPVPEIGTDIVATYSLTKKLGKSIKGSVHYRYRRLLKDDSSNDDIVELEFNPEKVEYRDLVNQAIYTYIQAFQPYYAYIGNEEFIYVDFKRSRNKNFRDEILRFHPVFFADAELCRRALQLSPLQIVEKVKSLVERAEICENGVLIVVTTKPVGVEEATTIHNTLSEILI